MSDDFTKTLFHPFETGMLEVPDAAARVLFLNAAPGFHAPLGFEAAISPVQDFRPDFLKLQNSGHAAQPQPHSEDYELALILLGRHRGRNELWLAEALERVRPGGRVVIAGGKTDGVASLAKRLSAMGVVEDRASKYHGVVFWLKRGDDAGQIAATLREANGEAVLEGGFRTVPGLFSHEHADDASQLLADNLPEGLKGIAADFGAGWGYLSVRLAQHAPGLAALDLYEAGFSACEMARVNMAALAAHVPAQIFWQDLLAEPVERRYDVIVMNPPFHQGRAAEPSIGERMIVTAAKALKQGGRLFLVANRPLPYETVLQQHFSRHGEIIRDQRFKLLWAIR